ncbi:MAG: glycosyltransferase [Alphaproteobacteria bacterium]|nr:glycosyltransferase [Alphaproteobacteria bacterium]
MTVIDANLKHTNAAAEFIAKGDHARDVRDWPGARAAYEEALRLNPNLAAIWIQLGHAAKESGDHAAAEGAYRKALEINPADADGHLQLGHLLKISGNISGALESYAQALAIDPLLMDAHAEVDALRHKLAATHGAKGPDAAVYPTFARPKRARADTLSIVFEVSDLLTYFQGSRLPTGIQRVQMEVIRSVAAMRDASFEYAIVCFAQDRGLWVEIPLHLFANFCKHSISGGDVTAPEWKALLVTLEATLKRGPRFQFTEGSLYVDLGTSWWQRNYFLNLRMAKSACGIRYIPFIHDLIPVMTPEYCGADLRRDFVAWISGVMHHADYFLVNSEATRSDLSTVAAELGRPLREIGVIKLDADFRRALGTAGSDADEDPVYFLQSHDLAAGKYVLCVATIEARKNHAAAFSVWLKLIKKHGRQKVPMLVCVGKDGWLNDGVYNMLKASEILNSHVLLLQNISDSALAALYQNCLCTIYPTFYEGWGLPVTEALSYGKVPVVANVSSLPEAGGNFAEYFDIGSENDLLAKMERVIFDQRYRSDRERQIAKEFKPRTWQQITEQVLDHLKRWAEPAAKGAQNVSHRAKAIVADAELGVLYPLARGTDTILWRGLEDSEVYRTGPAWWSTEDWGCWTKAGTPATLSFQVENSGGSKLLIYVGLRGLTDGECQCILKSEGARPVQITLPPASDEVAILELDASGEAKRAITVSIAGSRAADLSVWTEGRDPRVIGPGVLWFYICRNDDVLARVSMAEALATRGYARLQRQPPAKPDFFVHT